MADEPKPKARRTHQISAHARPGEKESVALARTALRPSVQASVTIKDYGKVWGDLDLSGLIQCLSEQIEATRGGDASRAEAMLTAQAHTLDAIFNGLAQHAINADYMDHLEKYLKLALRAQSQCRATWEAITSIKNPPVVGYVRQANIAQGHQQVNNTAVVGNGADDQAQESAISRNELLEAGNEQRMDARASCEASQADQAMAAVGEVDGAED